MAYNKTKIFQNMGKSIARFNKLDTAIDDLETIMGEHMALLDDDEDEREFEHNVHTSHEADKSGLEDSKANVISDLTLYMNGGLAVDLAVINPTAANVLDALEDAMYLVGDSVLKNLIPPDSNPSDSGIDVRMDIDNAGTGYGFLDVFHEQQRHADVNFEAECYDISGGAGSELWRIKNDDEDVADGATGTFLQSQKYGLEFKIFHQTTILEAGDNNNQLANWVINGAVKTTGDEESTGSLAKGNTDFYGLLYVKLFSTGGVNRTVELYKDAARTTELVASGSRDNDGEITLVQAGLSGVSGTVDVTYVSDDSDITIKLPFAFAVGDKLNFTTTVTTPGKFQTFFVEEFDRALPSESTGNETVDEAWAT